MCRPGDRPDVRRLHHATMTAPGTTYVFDDEAAGLVPETLCPATGSIQPTDYLTVGGGPPPAPNIATLSMFDGLDPNGTWTLYALSTIPVNASVAGGWSISLETPGPPPDRTQSRRTRPSLTRPAPAPGIGPEWRSPPTTPPPTSRASVTTGTTAAAPHPRLCATSPWASTPSESRQSIRPETRTPPRPSPRGASSAPDGPVTGAGTLGQPEGWVDRGAPGAAPARTRVATPGANYGPPWAHPTDQPTTPGGHTVRPGENTFSPPRGRVVEGARLRRPGGDDRS
jgi:hypothetical protein